MSADAVNWKWSAEHVGYTIIDIAAIIPGCDALKGLKYTDEIFMIVKRGDKEILIAAEKASEQLLKNDEVIGYAAKHGDELITAVGKQADEVGSSLKFKSDELLDSHYTKHSNEFGNITKEQYLEGANNLINSTGENILTKVRDNGDIIFYNIENNEFTVKTSDGFIRTYFKPLDGIDYFNRQ